MLMRFLLVLAVACSAYCADAPSRVPPGAKLFIAPMEGGLHGFLAPEFIKNKVPVVVVMDEADAQYILTGGTIKADDKWYHTVFSGKDKNEGNVQLISVKEKQLVWAGEAGGSLDALGWHATRRSAQGRGKNRETT